MALRQPDQFNLYTANKHHADAPSAARDSELILVRAPAHEGRSSIDAQHHQRRLPDGLPRCGVLHLGPDIRIAILRCRDDPVRVRGPVDGRYELVVLQRVAQ
jgi:hypothetical protein